MAIDRPDQELGAGGDGIAEAEPPLQPYHHLRLTIDSPRPKIWDVVWIDGASTVAYRLESAMHFERLTLAAAAAMRDATRDVEPFPAPRTTWSRALATREEHAVDATGGSGFDWPLVSGTLAIVLAVAVAAALLLRRGRRPVVA